jgi:hypothetical protein
LLNMLTFHTRGTLLRNAAKMCKHRDKMVHNASSVGVAMGELSM